MYQINVPTTPQPGLLDRFMNGLTGGINMANQLQAAQQARVMNPLDVQAKQAEIKNVLAKAAMYNAKANSQGQPGAVTYDSPAGKAYNDYLVSAKNNGENHPMTQALKAYALSVAGKGSQPAGPGFSIGQDGTQMNAPSSAQPPAQPTNALSQFASPTDASNSPKLPTLPGPNASNVTGGMPLTMSPDDAAKLAGVPGLSSPQSGGQPNNAPGNLVQVPTSAHTAKGNQGSTYIDQNTGNAVSVPTSKTISTAQTSILAGRILEPQLKNVFNDIAPVLGNNKFFDRLGNRIQQQAGQEAPEMDKYDAAVNTSLPTMAEGLLKNAGMNPTHEQSIVFSKSITPLPTETKYQYARRIANTITGLQMRDENYVNTLRSSLPLQQQSDLSPVMAQMQEHIYHSLIGSKGSVAVRLPSGHPATIPQENLAEAKKRGAVEL